MFFMGLFCILCFFAYKSALKLIYPLKYESIVRKASETYGVDKELIFAIIKCESGFDEKAHSRASAKGLMQITPETFGWLKTCYSHDKKISVSSLEDPNVNISYGTLLLSILMKKYKNEDAVLSAYNAGIATVNRWLSDKEYSPNGLDLNSIPYEETKNYVKRVKKAKKIYKNLYF